MPTEQVIKTLETLNQRKYRFHIDVAIRMLQEEDILTCAQQIARYFVEVFEGNSRLSLGGNPKKVVSSLAVAEKPLDWVRPFWVQAYIEQIRKNFTQTASVKNFIRFLNDYEGVSF